MIVYIIMAFVLITIVMFLNKKYKNTNAYYNQYYLHWDFKNKNIEKIIILGSTYARYAFEGLKYLRIANTNLTLNSQSVEDTYKNLKKIMDKLDSNIVVLSLAPCTLMYEGKGFFKLPGTSKVSFNQKIKYLFPIYNPKRLIKLVFDDGRYVDVYDARSQINCKKVAEKNMLELVNVWKKTFNLEKLVYEEVSNDNLRIVGKNISYLHMIADICAQKDCSLYIVIPPFSELLNAHLPDEFVNNVLLNPLQDLIKIHKNVVLVNHRQDTEFQKMSDYIDGGFLLNRNGSIKFINLLNTSLVLEISNKANGLDY